MSTRKAVLLEDLIAYLIRHGVADLSLRPMAAAAGTSARLLIFHFGSKERLLIEALDEMQARLQRSLADLLAGESGVARPAPLRLFWDWALKEPNLPQLRIVAVFDGLLMEVMSTGDRRRASAAIDDFLVMARKHANARRPTRKPALQ